MSARKENSSARDSLGSIPTEGLTPSTTPHTSPVLKHRKTPSPKQSKNTSWYSQSTEFPNTTNAAVLRKHRRQYSDSLTLPTIAISEEQDGERSCNETEQNTDIDLKKLQSSLSADNISQPVNDGTSLSDTSVLTTTCDESKNETDVVVIVPLVLHTEDADFLTKLRSNANTDIKLFQIQFR